MLFRPPRNCRMLLITVGRKPSKGGMGASSTGKIQSDGLTYWSATFRDNTVEIYFQGDKGAVKTADGWQSLADAGQDTGGGPTPGAMAGAHGQKSQIACGHGSGSG